MTGMRRPLMTAGLLAVAYSTPLNGQAADTIAAIRADAPRSSLVRVSKWTTLGLSIGAAVYGFSENRSADREYEALERRCADDVVNCERRIDERYADAEMERSYQQVRTRDARARTALLASQLGIAASVALFIYDLRDNRPPRDIPYEPRAVQLMPGNDGAVQLRLTLPLPVRKR
jgi:hypothetical protein